MKSTTQSIEKKYVLMRGMHLGNIKQTFNAGTVIIHDEDANALKIDGKKYESTKDLDILISHKWVELYSKSAVDKAKKSSKTPVVQESPHKEEQAKRMQVIKSDEDLMDKSIDISYTKKPKPVIEKKDNTEMEIIRGDESPAERIARLQSTIPQMPVIKDDSLGAAGLVKTTTNTVSIKTPEEHKKLREEAVEKIKRGRGRPPGSKNKNAEINSTDFVDVDAPKKAKKAKE